LSVSGQELLWQLVRKHICGHAFRTIRVAVNLCRAWYFALQRAPLVEGSWSPSLTKQLIGHAIWDLF